MADGRWWGAMVMVWERHPVFRMITPEEAVKRGPQWFADAIEDRERLIYMAKTDPLNWGWEPDVFEVADALLGINLFDYGSGEWEEKRDLNKAYREVLGFPGPVTALLINGGNQIGKTEYAIKRQMQLRLRLPESTGWAFHSSEDMSKQAGSHQPGFWRYMPKELKSDTGIKTSTTYVAFKQKTGFSENAFILPNMASQQFKFYGMDQDKAIQGPNIHDAWLDELFQLAWLQDLMFRVAKQNGFVLGTFTPKNGYSASCAWFYEGAEVVRKSVAFLLPTDGGMPDIPRALGFENEAEYELAYRKGKDSKGNTGYGPNSKPEKTRNWLTGERSQPEIPAGRGFEMVPRVMRCAPIKFDGEWKYNRAVLFFHSCDGPFGNPINIIGGAQTMATKEIKWRVYGYATKMETALIGNFDQHHICKREEIPEAGTNYHFMDPAPGRNPFQTWIRVSGLDMYVYREWPGNYEIPGEGVPGNWVEPNDKYPDGEKGAAQDSFGWGILKMKQELARLEEWGEYNAVGDGVAEWLPENGAKEMMAMRFMDSRAASSPKLENDRSTTLLTQFEDVGLVFMPTPADDIQSGVQALIDLFDWHPDDDRSLSDMRLHVCEDCVNTIQALRMWTNRNGQKGACKDPVDNLRYAALSQLYDVGSEGLETILRAFG